MPGRSTADIISDRARLLGANVATVYEEPVHFVRGEGVWLWDDDGRQYLDCYNNVPHVGHCNLRVVEAIRAQASTLNIHTRYLHDAILDYVERLTGTMAGAELVLDRDSMEPATAFADRVVNALRHRGIILSSLGRRKNTLKIRPPMPFSIQNADLLIDTLDEVLAETGLHP